MKDQNLLYNFYFLAVAKAFRYIARNANNFNAEIHSKSAMDE